MDPNIVRFANAVSNIAKLLGALLVAKGVFTQDSHTVFWLEFVSGSAMVIVPAIYDLVVSGSNVIKSLAIGAQAGINLTLSGKAVDHNGNTISRISADATPFKPVTEVTGVQIAQKFGPAAADVAKS